MSSIIQNKFHEILGDAARTTKFTFVLPPLTGSAETMDHIVYAVKSLTLPTIEHSPLEIRHKGLPIPIRGVTKFSQTFDVTFYLSETHATKRFFEEWMMMMEQRTYYYNPRKNAKFQREVHKMPESDMPPYMTWYNVTAWVEQWDFDGMKPTAMYEIFNVFPTKVSAPNYSYDSVGQIAEFTVTFACSHYKLHSKKMRHSHAIQNQLYHTTNKWSQLGEITQRGIGAPYVRGEGEFWWDEDKFMRINHFNGLEQTSKARQEIYWRPDELARWDNMWNRYREATKGANTNPGKAPEDYNFDEVEDQRGTLDYVLRKKYATVGDRDYVVKATQ